MVMIKGKLPFPFQSIAVAVAFSPRLSALLSEAKYYSEKFNTKLLLLHAGKKTKEKESILSNAINDLKINQPEIIWANGSPIEAILSECKKNVVDLLMLGADEKENILKFYMGSVSREIARKAKCSVLLLTDPQVEPKPVSKIVVNAHDHQKTVHTIHTSMYFANQMNCSSITLMDEVDLPGFSMSLSDDSTRNETKQIQTSVLNEEEIRLKEILSGCKLENLTVDVVKTKGRTGYTISKFASENHADLLVVNSPDHHLTIFDRIFSHDIEYLLQELPCNLLIVHSRIPEQENA